MVCLYNIFCHVVVLNHLDFVSKIEMRKCENAKNKDISWILFFLKVTVLKDISLKFDNFEFSKNISIKSSGIYYRERLDMKIKIKNVIFAIYFLYSPALFSYEAKDTISTEILC